MPTVAVVTTGGTIASRRDEDGVSRPVVTGPDLLATGAERAATEVRVTDVLSKDSSCMTFADMDRVCEAIAAELRDPTVAGVVVLHGTDTMEETAFLVDLHHADPRPVVFTGAQRTFDHPESDAQANLTAALSAATDSAMRGRGVLISFGGKLHPVPGVRKADTTALDAFRSVRTPMHRHRPEPLPWRPISGVRVDVVAIYPGTDRVQFDACRSAGAHGVVLDALGSGNANPGIVEAVRECVAAGVPVAVSTRVPYGSISPTYGGGGGGSDLVAAGALFSTDLRAGQARILLAALLADPDLTGLEKEFDRRSRIEL
ncbi:asparaginase [Rhodococcus sp. MSC1_016]|uniref:asparaginase n=1 Tax=Rhodococcus sp. MSC1_016 TaxID=2909266 RepID=UPI00202F6D14|nr:asparaginase [Rhodococcus sp. MSC1_016]